MKLIGRFFTCALCFVATSVLRADHFDEHTAAVLIGTPSAKVVKKVDSLPLRKIPQLPQVVDGALGSAFLVVRTNEGNWTKLLLRQAGRRVAGKEEPVNFALFERLVTYPADIRRSVVADQKNVHLFDKFRIDLDIGEVVPPGMGEDLEFVNDENGGKLVALPEVDLYVVGAPLVAPSQGGKGERKFSEGAVQPTDFAGKYKLDADGRWSGELLVIVDESGVVTGTFKSEKSGQTYNINGEIGTPANHIIFKIALPRTEQEFDGYLWTQARNRISGVSRMEGQPFGFDAQRIE